MLSVPINQFGRRLQDWGWYRTADAFYFMATRLEPSWSAPWFNRGLMAKFRHDWPECYRLTLKSTELDPDFKAGWWNLGIAATAISDWAVARRAWWRYGISVPLGEGPPDMDLGSVPIRICPDTIGEVVWCQRLDPARARISSVPLPESGHAYQDVLLTDGEPKGHRSLSGRDVPVFNELATLVPSAFHTFSAQVLAPSSADINALIESSDLGTLRFEDWSGMGVLCKACSEGSPDDHERSHADEWQANRRVGVAAVDEANIEAALDAWTRGGSGREVASLECVLERT